MQEAGDRLVLAAAVFDHQGGDGEQVGEVRDGRALAPLGGMGDAGVVDGLDETVGRTVMWPPSPDRTQ